MNPPSKLYILSIKTMIQNCPTTSGPWFEEQILKIVFSPIQQHHLQHLFFGLIIHNIQSYSFFSTPLTLSFLASTLNSTCICILSLYLLLLICSSLQFGGGPWCQIRYSLFTNIPLPKVMYIRTFYLILSALEKGGFKHFRCHRYSGI